VIEKPTPKMPVEHSLN